MFPSYKPLEILCPPNSLHSKLNAPACTHKHLLAGFCPFLNADSSNNHPALSVQDRIKDIYNSSKDCVVRVKATRKDTLEEKTNRVLKMGSGFFVSKEGHVLTTGLLRNVDQIWIEHSKSFYLAQLIGHDYLCNVSLLKVVEPKRISLFIHFKPI